MNAGITTDTLASAYELLRTSTPFRNLKLPPAYEVVFKLNKDKTRTATCDFDDPAIICISIESHSHLYSLIVTMAHEMLHLYEFRKYGKTSHGASFRKLANRVCKAHGFDPKMF